jgi:hypothetical protein
MKLSDVSLNVIIGSMNGQDALDPQSFDLMHLYTDILIDYFPSLQRFQFENRFSLSGIIFLYRLKKEEDTKLQDVLAQIKAVGVGQQSTIKKKTTNRFCVRMKHLGRMRFCTRSCAFLLGVL